MPEGPSIVILREQAAGFIGKSVRDVAGNSRLDLERMRGQRVRDLRSWGKHFLVCCDGSRCACISCCSAAIASTSGAKPHPD